MGKVRYMEIQGYNSVFYSLIKKYDFSDSHIMQKLSHCFLVADQCFSLAASLYMSVEERQFAYMCGLFHDIGRMEQWHCFASFSDSRTRHHAMLGADILTKNNIAAQMGLPKNLQKALVDIVKFHAEPYNGKNKDVITFLPILRNADNYVNLRNAAFGVEKLWVTKNGYSPEVLEKFKARQNLHGTPIKTKLDRLLQLLSRAYSIEYPILKKDFLARKYLNSIYENYSPELNIADRKIFYEECWRLKRELAFQMGASTK